MNNGSKGNGSNKNTAVLGLIAVVVIGALVGGTILLKPKDSSSSSTDSSTGQTDNSSANTTSDASSGSSNSSTNSSATYKDGTYTAEGSYSSPGGNEEISVTITITAGKVTDSSVTPRAASSESNEYQQDFVSGYKVLVTGKDLATLNLSRVSGSSLTSRGFNEALDAIRNQAQS